MGWCHLTVYRGVVRTFLMCMLSVFHFEFSIASALHEHECEQFQNRTVVVELGDSVSRVFHVTSLNITEYLSGDVLTFVKNGDHVISRCAVSLHHSIECQSNDERIGIYMIPRRENSVTLEINVTTFAKG